MDFYNKTTLLPSLDELYILLVQGRIIQTDCFFCVGPRIAIEHRQDGIKHSIRIWRTNSLFNYWYEELTSKNFIAALDYIIYPPQEGDYVKIDYLYINDGEYSGDYNNLYEDPLDEIEAQDLNDNLIKFVVNIAKTNGLPRIVKDVHQNLRIYNKYFKSNGFKLTYWKCIDNPYWLETEKHISSKN